MRLGGSLIAIVALLAGCATPPAPPGATASGSLASRNSAAAAASRPADPESRVTLLHVNDHHSHLDADTATLRLKLSDGQRHPVQVERGGFDRVVRALERISAGAPNVIKIHAGDAITGDLYYSLFQGKADADLMNQACFDTFTLGNHEFDHGDAKLKRFLEFLRDGSCNTRVLSANVQFGESSPLHPTLASDFVRGSVVLHRGRHAIGLVGLTTARKTANSSRPDPGTRFEDEATAAQAQIDRLRSQGVNRIVLQTHLGYAADLELAARLHGVDVIVGGDSHTLLGPDVLKDYGLRPAAPYPTLARNKDGQVVCVAQAWQYGYVVGQLDVDFDAQSNVKSCTGTPHLLIGNTFEREGRPLEPADRAAALADIAAGGVLRITPSSPAAQARLAAYRQRKQELGQEVIAHAAENLCLRRIPGQRLDAGRSSLGDTCNLDPHVQAHGGDIQQHVAQALLQQGREYFGAQIAIQNAGGVRTDVPRGDIDVEAVYGLLPFGNALVRLDATGGELKQALEDAVDAIFSRSASGSYPYAAGLRWKVDLGQPRGNRLSDLEVHDGLRGWQPLRPAATYTVATTNYLADGMDGYAAFGTIQGERREDVGLMDAEIFLEYLKTLPGSPARLARLPGDQYSTQAFIEP